MMLGFIIKNVYWIISRICNTIDYLYDRVSVPN